MALWHGGEHVIDTNSLASGRFRSNFKYLIFKRIFVIIFLVTFWVFPTEIPQVNSMRARRWQFNIGDDYDEFKLRLTWLTTRCHSSDVDKLEIFWFSLFLFLAKLSLLLSSSLLSQLLWWKLILHPYILEWTNSDLFFYIKRYFYLCICVYVIG